VWIKRVLLLLFFLVVLSGLVYGLSDIEKQRLEELKDCLKTVYNEVQILKSQREQYKIEILNLSESLKKNEMSLQSYKQQVADLKASIESLNHGIESKEKLLKESQEEISKLMLQSEGLSKELNEALKSLKTLQNKKELFEILFYVTVGVFIGKEIYDIFSRRIQIE
jgi:chromosome segregation ATPase